MALFSIGHSNLPAESFLRLLHEHQINLLADVRSKPFSRFNRQFDRPTLAATLKAAGIDYVWCGEHLGALGDTRIGPEFIAAMDELIAASKEQNVALMCAESDPAQCHRASKLGAWLASARAIPIHHIVGNELLTHAQIELGGRQRPHLNAPQQGELEI
jgi:uncharacterized protein (DUF488 family)